MLTAENRSYFLGHTAKTPAFGIDNIPVGRMVVTRLHYRLHYLCLYFVFTG
jgi:hypothetical protein